MRVLFCSVFLFLSALPAAANVADYCAAYARDHADQGPREKLKWQKRYDDALQTCGEQFSLQAPAPKTKNHQNH